MRPVITSGVHSIAHLFMGDSRLKRVALRIRTPKVPDREFTGYALVNELNERVFSFFCTEKFSLEDELEIEMKFSGHDLCYRVAMSHLHEQISSGRIMNALPSAENPFPARKFYRCFSKVLEMKGMEKEDGRSAEDTSLTTAAPTEEATPAQAA